MNFDTPERVARYASEFGRGVLFLCDPDRRLYQRFDLGRASRARIWLDPRVRLAYVRLLRQGHRRLMSPSGDTQQLGGDVVLDRELRATWIYRSAGPEDRPPLAVVREHAVRAGTRI